MMKKIIAATLALTLSMSMGNFVYATDDSSADIKASSGQVVVAAT